jgi:hypothetical protein
MGVSGQLYAPATLSLGEESLAPTGPTADLEAVEKSKMSASPRDWTPIPSHPAHRLVTILTIDFTKLQYFLNAFN